jgi:hypothetical protein
MAIPSATAGGAPLARAQFIDQGENLDVSQVLAVGGSVKAGQTANNQLYGQAMAVDTVTAHAGGGQANGVPVTTPLIRVTVVASAADSITLPPAIRGMEILVLNDAAANAMNVFPAVGETINAGAANAALSVAAQNGAGTGPTIFVCFTNGAWRTK